MPACETPPARGVTARRGVTAQIRRGEIELGERNALDLIEADAGEIFREHRRVADEHDRELVGMQVLLRDALDVVDA